MNNQTEYNEVSAELRAAYINAAIDRARRAEPLRRLQMRLMYAQYKVNQGWAKNTLEEVSAKYSKLCKENKKKRPDIYDMNKHFFTDLIRESGDSMLNSMIGPDTRREGSPYGRKGKRPVSKGAQKSLRSPQQNVCRVVTRRQPGNLSSHEDVQFAESQSNVEEGVSLVSPKATPSASPASPESQSVVAAIDYSNPNPEVLAAELILSFCRGRSDSPSTDSVKNESATIVADNTGFSSPPTSDSSQEPIKAQSEPQTQQIPAMQTQAPQYIYGNQFHYPAHQLPHSQYSYVTGHPTGGPSYFRGLNLIAGAAGIV